MDGLDRARTAALVSVCAFAGACSPEAPDPGGGARREGPPPNIVVVCIDTVRADHTSLFGYERRTTPNLERIAEQGLVLERHFANASWTKPSVASIITGLHPSAHGSRIGQFSAKKKEQFVEVLSDENVTLAELLREAGYRTVAHVTNYNMLARFGYGQGYDEYRFVDGATGNERVNGSDREAMEFALEALAASDGPVFAWVHMMSVHQYIAPPEFQRFQAPADVRTPIDKDALAHGRVKDYATVEDAVADYDNAILYTDALVGELFDALRADHPDTVLVVTSDHGEEFYDHGGFEHASTLYNEMLRVPAVLCGPGVPSGRVEGITDSIDLLPTLVELAGAGAAGQTFRGQSLVARGAPTAGKPATFAEQHHRGPFRRFSLVEGGSKLIRSERKKNGAVQIEFYADGFSIERDETSEQADAHTLEAMGAGIDLLRRAAEAHNEGFVGDRRTESLSAQDLAELKALGYAE